MIRLRQSGVDEILIKRVWDWYDPGPGVFIQSLTTALFSPEMLFTGSTNGVYFDPNNSATLFEDAAGTIPTALERPVGLMRDLSGRGNHATSSSTARPTLTRRVNQFVNSETLQTQSVTTRATTQTLRFEGAGTITLFGAATGVYTAGAYSITTTAGTLTATVLGTVTRADLREANFGVGLPAYQRVGDTSVNAADYDTAGFPAWLRCSGGQSMVTPSINLTAVDKLSLFCALRKSSDNNQAVFLDGGNISGNLNLFTLQAPSISPNKYLYTQTGTTAAPLPFVTGSQYAAPQTVVFTGYGSISTDENKTRINGVNVVQSTADQGSNANGFANLPVVLFARNQSSLFFNGLAGPIIVRGAQSSAAEIANAEAWINAQQKVY